MTGQRICRIRELRSWKIWSTYAASEVGISRHAFGEVVLIPPPTGFLPIVSLTSTDHSAVVKRIAELKRISISSVIFNELAESLVNPSTQAVLVAIESKAGISALALVIAGLSDFLLQHVSK
jgi:hypothetical protein